MMEGKLAALRYACLPLYPLGFQCLDTICFKLLDLALGVQSPFRPIWC